MSIQLFVPLTVAAKENEPDPFPKRTEKPFRLVAAISILPSLLKSEQVMPRGFVPTEKLGAVKKLPVPVPNNTEILLELLLAVAISLLPSLLKSAAQILRCELPTANVLPKVDKQNELCGL